MEAIAGKTVEPCGLSKHDIHALAEKFARRVRYAPGDDLEELVRKLGGTVEIRDLAELGRSGSIQVHAPGRFTIFLPSYTGRLRDRFTIAHELGHYVLHSRLGKHPIHVMREGSGRTEWEANWFAAAFLMPEGEFRRRLEASQSDAEIALYFDVSPSAVEVRKKSLEG